MCFQKGSARSRAILEPGRTELPERPPRKGRCGQVPKKRHQAFIDYQKEILRFARPDEVPFTNHRDEPGLQMAKTKQKVSGTFRTLPHAPAHGRLSSDLKTSANQGVGPFTAIRLALQGALGILDITEYNTASTPTYAVRPQIGGEEMQVS